MEWMRQQSTERVPHIKIKELKSQCEILYYRANAMPTVLFSA